MAPPRLPAIVVGKNEVGMVRTAAGPMSARAYKFAVEYVKAGGRGAGKIALDCGYSSPTTASALLRDEKVLAILELECRTSLRAAIVVAARQIEYLAVNGSVGDSVKLKAAESILDRCSKILAKVTEHRVTVADERAPIARSAAQLEEAWTANAADMGLAVVDPDKLRRYCEAMESVAKRKHGDAIDVEFDEVGDEPEDDGRAGLEDLL